MNKQLWKKAGRRALVGRMTFAVEPLGMVTWRVY